MPAADVNDPAFFRRKEDPPEFDIAAGKEDWPIWKLKWASFIDSSGIGSLTEGNGNDEAKLLRNQAITKHRYNALIKAFSTKSLRTVRSLSLVAGDKEDADKIITAVDTFIVGATNVLDASQRAPLPRLGHKSIDSFAVSLKDLAQGCPCPTR